MSRYNLTAAVPGAKSVAIANLFKGNCAEYAPIDTRLLSVLERLSESHPVIGRERETQELERTRWFTYNSPTPGTGLSYFAVSQTGQRDYGVPAVGCARGFPPRTKSSLFSAIDARRGDFASARLEIVTGAGVPR